MGPLLMIEYADQFVKDLIRNLYQGTFGVRLPRIKTRVKVTEQGEASITFKDENNKGFLIFYSPNSRECNLQYKGNHYQKLLQKLMSFYASQSIKFKISAFTI